MKITQLHSETGATKRRFALVFTTAIWLISVQWVNAGTWANVASPAPGGVQLMLLLSDGTVMCSDGGGGAWFKLSPNASGSYVNGTWTTNASMTFTRRYFSSQVLQNGKVMVAGGEYGNGCATTEIYDPVANTWTSVPVPPGLLCTCPQADGSCGAFRDSSSMLLPNGRMLVAPVNPATNNQTLIYNPVANSWTGGPVSLGDQNEANWVKLPDDSILTMDKNSTQSERFIPSLNQWINDANAPVNLYGVGSEIGPGIMLADGRAFYLGGNNNTAIYTPSGTTNQGNWIAGPPIPNGQACPDAPAAMLVNGKILLACNPLGIPGTTFPTKVSFYEYDPVANSYARQSSPTGGLIITNIAAYQTSMLCLPDGNVLVSDESSQVYVYQPGAAPLAAGKPTISSITANGDGSYHLSGTRLNGLSAGASYGDDEQMDSNYPLVRAMDGNGNVFYGRTYNWSSTGVATGNAPVSTDFALFLDPGPYSLVAVANGIASDPVTFFGQVWVDFNYGGAVQDGRFGSPWKTLAGGISAVPVTGTIALKPGLSHETMTISKAMTLIAIGGTATIGQ